MTKLIRIAKTIKAHGVVGKLKCFIDCSHPNNYLKLDSISIGADPHKLKSYNLESIKISQKHFILKLEEIDSRTGAEQLAGLNLYSPIHELNKSGEIQYTWLDQKPAVNMQDAPIGKIIDLIESKWLDWLVIENKQYGNLMIPVTGSTIVEVETDYVKLDFPDELLTLNC